MNPETAKNPVSTLHRIDPMNPETTKNPVSTFPGIHPMNPERPAAPRPKPPLTTLTPTKAHALRSTTLANTHQDLRAQLTAKFGPPPTPPGWRIPQTPPTTGRAVTHPPPSPSLHPSTLPGIPPDAESRYTAATTNVESQVNDRSARR
jgi:hypothetical protein